MILSSVMLALLLFFNLAALWDAWNEKTTDAQDYFLHCGTALLSALVSGLILLTSVLGWLPAWTGVIAWGCALISFWLTVKNALARVELGTDQLPTTNR